jgi:hypothetical protein
MPPVSVPLQFSPPTDENIVTLRVYESALAEGPFLLIDTTNEVGTYPDYIDNYTTEMANSAIYWFAIQWVDESGAESPLSAPIQGNANTLVAEVVQRVRDRDPYLNTRVVIQEAEAAIQGYFGGVQDPYDPTLTATYQVLNGLAYLTMARAHLFIAATSGDVDSATIGLVSFRSSSGASSLADIERLIAMANEMLNISTSVILLLEDIQIGSSVSNVWRDQSRLMLETEIQ